MSDLYGEDYFERGVESGKSLYSNYRWMPELTIPMAHEIIKILGLQEGDRVLDFGCAKGYLVQALRLLYIEAYGVDSSGYAIDCASSDVREYLYHELYPLKFQAVIAKDVLEHLTSDQLDDCLSWCSQWTANLFVVVPLGNDGKYTIPAYDLDTTHVIKESLLWWGDKIKEYEFNVTCSYQMGHLKENWMKHNDMGNGFIVGRK